MPVSMTTPVCASATSSRIFRHTSHPLMPGIMTSSTTRSGRCSRARRQACSPSEASMTSTLGLSIVFRCRATSSSIVGSSSATRMSGLVDVSMRAIVGLRARPGQARPASIGSTRRGVIDRSAVFTARRGAILHLSPLLGRFAHGSVRCAEHREDLFGIGHGLRVVDDGAVGQRHLGDRLQIALGHLHVAVTRR